MQAINHNSLFCHQATLPKLSENYLKKDFCCVGSNIAPISSSFSSVITQHFLVFLVQKWRSRPNFLNKFKNACCAWNCYPRKSVTKFSPTLSNRATFHIQLIHTEKPAVQQYIKPIHTHTHTQNNDDDDNQYLTQF